MSTASTATPYIEIVGQMVLAGVGMGLTTAPATEAIMGVVPKEKAGIGSAVNDATRELGATLGVAIIGSVYASLYASGIQDAAGTLPAPALDAASDSIGAAITVAGQLGPAGQPLLEASQAAFFDGFALGCLVAASVLIAGAAFAARFLPSRPTSPPHPNPCPSRHRPSKPPAPPSPQAYPAAAGTGNPPPQPANSQLRHSRIRPTMIRPIRQADQRDSPRQRSPAANGATADRCNRDWRQRVRERPSRHQCCRMPKWAARAGPEEIRTDYGCRRTGAGVIVMTCRREAGRPLGRGGLGAVNGGAGVARAGHRRNGICGLACDRRADERRARRPPPGKSSRSNPRRARASRRRRGRHRHR